MPEALNIPTTPTKIQNEFNKLYALSFRKIAHQLNKIASMVLKIQTNKNGLSEPNQLTRLKLIIRITTPSISILVMFSKIN